MSVQTLQLGVRLARLRRGAVGNRLRIGAQHGHRFVTVFRMALFNLGALALLGASFVQGWAQTVFRSDITGLTWVIAAVFAFGLSLSFVKAWKIASETNCVRNRNPCAGTWASDYLDSVQGRSAGSRAIAASTLRVQVAAKISSARHVAGSLVLLGLIGTVLGFIIALAGVTAESASDLGAVSDMVSRLISGMSVALYTTLEGAVLSLWLTVNYQILTSGAVRLVSGLVLLGESNERSRSDS